MPDIENKDFFCSSCQTHKKGRLYSHGIKNRKVCTTCSMPIEERKKMGINNIYENLDTQQPGDTNVKPRPS